MTPTEQDKELDEILQQNIQFTLLGEFPNAVPDHNNWVNVMGRVYSFAFTEAKQALLDWHNKQVEAVLDRLDKSMPTSEQLTTKYGYHMPEKQYGYKIGLHDIREVIEAERNKLKESE